MSNALAAMIERQRQREQDDPLILHRFSSEQAREMVESVCKATEVYLRSGNVAGKTTEGAFLGVALARGVRVIDGRTIREDRDSAPARQIELPLVPTPNIGILAVDSYKGSSESSVAAYRRWLGNHPHRIIKGPLGNAMEIRVKPDRGRTDDTDNWSKILIFPSDGSLPLGIRAHWAHADEPPGFDLWTEIRMRLSRGHPLYRWITATPLKRETWEWLREDYARAEEWKQEIVLDVSDNQALGQDDLKRIYQSASSHPLEAAKLHGAYVDTSGINPFRPQWRQLERWLQGCSDPIREEDLMVNVEVDTESGIAIKEGMGKLYVWEEPLPGERYYVIGDPSLGLDDAEHDPCGCHVVRRGFSGNKPGTVARYNGFVGAYGLGWLMASAAERYNDALVDPDVTGGWGRPTLRALSDYKSEKFPHGYPNINRDRRVDGNGANFTRRLGFAVNAENKADLIESLRAALMGNSYELPSAASVRCLMEAVMDPQGRLAKPRGTHYEDLHCVGRACQLLLDRHQAEEAARFIERSRIPAGFQRRSNGRALYGMKWRRASA